MRLAFLAPELATAGRRGTSAMCWGAFATLSRGRPSVPSYLATAPFSQREL